MTCDQITPAELKQLKPKFSAVDDDVVQQYIDLAQIWAAGDWSGSNCGAVQASVVCHLMTLDGLGTGAESRTFYRGDGEYQTIKSGGVTFVRFKSVADGAGMSTSQWFAQTSCGRMFLAIRRALVFGPVVVVGSVDRGVSGYAKDSTIVGWW
jgi:hypothetical protein